MSRTAEYIVTGILGFVVGALVAVVTMGALTPTDYQRFHVVCEYEGGAVYESLCIRDNKVIEVSP